MSARNRCSGAFRKDAVSKVVDRSYPVAEVADLLGVSMTAIYTGKAQFSKPGMLLHDLRDQGERISENPCSGGGLIGGGVPPGSATGVVRALWRQARRRG